MFSTIFPHVCAQCDPLQHLSKFILSVYVACSFNLNLMNTLIVKPTIEISLNHAANSLTTVHDQLHIPHTAYFLLLGHCGLKLISLYIYKDDQYVFIQRNILF